MLRARHTVAIEEEERDSKTPNDDGHTIIVAYGKQIEEWHEGNSWSVGGSKIVSPDAAGTAPPSLADTETSSSIIISNNNPQRAMTLVIVAMACLTDYIVTAKN